MKTTITTVKTICDECGADMTSEPKPTPVAPNAVTVNKKDFRVQVTTLVESISR